jgi:hypothetical protein
MNCGIASMARKANLARQLEEMHGRAEITDRQPSGTAAALYLIQLRSAARRISTPRRRLAIAIEREAGAETPQPVKIVCVDKI